MTLKKIFLNGLWSENPVFRQLLGMCPTLAVTTEAKNGLTMGLATLFVLTCSSFIISSLRQIIPRRVRIPCFIIIIATFVTITDLCLEAWLPQLHKVLGIFIPLIVVNCIIMGRAEAFASKNSIGRAVIDAVGCGIGFTIALLILGGVREILGQGTIFGKTLFGANYRPLLVMILPPGAFILLGGLIAGMNKIGGR
jgi:electron transport complex protein RnfE